MSDIEEQEKPEEAKEEQEEEAKHESYDIWMIVCIAILLIVGLLMVFSASSIFAARKMGSQYYFIWRQGFFACIGCLLAFFVARLSREILYKYIWLWISMSLVLLGFTAFPDLPFVVNSHNATRWISLGLFNIQPMEFAKIAFALYLANFYAYKRDKLHKFTQGALPSLVLLLFFCAILMKQPDFGATSTFVLLWLAVSFVGMVPLKQLIVMGIFSAIVLVVFVSISPYRMRRIQSFGNPFEDAQRSGYQVAQSLLSFGIGGTTGVGIGASSQKASFLPEAHTDFIMSVLAEETGFIGTSIILLLFLFFFIRCYRVILGQEDNRDRLVAIALTCLLAFGMLGNFAVAMGIIPAKGIAMPFISYGGSSLVANLIIVGLLLNLSRSVKR